MLITMRRRRALSGRIGLAFCAPGAIAILSLPGCGQSAQNTSGAGTSSQPDATLTWLGRGGAFVEWGCGGDFIYGLSKEPKTLDVWRWEGDRAVKYKQVECGDDKCVTWIPGDRYVFTRWGEPEGKYAAAKEAATASVTRKWLVRDRWYCDTIQASRSGQYVGLCLKENGPDTPGHEFGHPRVVVGLIGPGVEDVTWLPVLAAQQSELVKTVLPSDDGAYVALAAWDHGVGMVDVAAKRLLWSRMPGSNTIDYVAFSPDSQVVFGGGTEGAVYSMDVKTGNVLGKWYASESGKEEYGHRISCMAVSPDGRWLAAGTGPEGLVFVGSTATNKCVKVLRHLKSMGVVELVHFSPTSKALATFVPGTLKIWNVSQWDKTPPAPSTGAAQTQPSATTQSDMHRP